MKRVVGAVAVAAGLGFSALTVNPGIGYSDPAPPPGRTNHGGPDGPPRDVVYAQRDFGPFAYNTFTVIPVFNWMYGGWGYWFFGVWIPLY